MYHFVELFMDFSKSVYRLSLENNDHDLIYMPEINQ